LADRGPRCSFFAIPPKEETAEILGLRPCDRQTGFEDQLQGTWWEKHRKTRNRARFHVKNQHTGSYVPRRPVLLGIRFGRGPRPRKTSGVPGRKSCQKVVYRLIDPRNNTVVQQGHRSVGRRRQRRLEGRRAQPLPELGRYHSDTFRTRGEALPRRSQAEETVRARRMKASAKGAAQKCSLISPDPARFDLTKVLDENNPGQESERWPNDAVDRERPGGILPKTNFLCARSGIRVENQVTGNRMMKGPRRKYRRSNPPALCCVISLSRRARSGPPKQDPSRKDPTRSRLARGAAHRLQFN